jgi:alanyl-tRNA synthetase
MTGDKLRRSFLEFFRERGHAVIPSAPLVPEHDPTVLFTSAGMHPLVPYLLGEAHPAGKRLADVQLCLRTDDIEEVGDATHNTFFEMLGFWSLGDYGKDDSLRWTLEWFTDVLGLDRSRIAVTVFAGDADAPRDDEAIRVWRALGMAADRIFPLPKSDNWWGPAGQTGPCGPDSELFYDTLRPACGPDCRPGCNCGKWVEIGNNVFMEYRKTAEGTFERLAQRNIDVGLGLERLLAMLNGAPDIYHTDLFAPIMARIAPPSSPLPIFDGEGEISRGADIPVRLSNAENQQRLRRIVADHVRAGVFVIADGVPPTNVEQGYIARRLLRRAVRCGHELGIGGNLLATIGQAVITTYRDVYPQVGTQAEMILATLAREEDRFRQTLVRGLREFDRQEANLRAQGATTVPGEVIFRLFDTFGFPPSLTAELAQERGLAVDMAGYEARFQQHRAQSRLANQDKFAGGLADHSVATTRLHTATHLLQQALRDVLGNHVHQLGSNITPERLRFDFAHPSKPAPEEIARVEAIVNAQIARDLPVSLAMLPLETALAQGALAFFGERYPDVVKVYRIGDYSLEVCGGPHVKATHEVGQFRITKVETIGQGVQRIRAVLTP